MIGFEGKTEEQWRVEAEAEARLATFAYIPAEKTKALRRSKRAEKAAQGLSITNALPDGPDDVVVEMVGPLSWIITGPGNGDPLRVMRGEVWRSRSWLLHGMGKDRTYVTAEAAIVRAMKECGR